MVTLLDAEYNRLINELSDLNREISGYRTEKTSGQDHDWYEDFEPIMERHRAVTARLREIAELRAGGAKE